MVPARSIWNQLQYHVTNVNDDGTIPQFEQPPWEAGVGWLAQQGRRVVADAGSPTRICEGTSVTLDGSASVACGSLGLEYRWLDGVVEVCGWSPTPTCDVTPSGTTLYTLEVRCFGAPGCLGSDSDTVLVEVFPATLPPDLGNSVRVVKTGVNDLSLSWASVPEASTYTLHRGTQKGLWVSPPFRPDLTGTTETLPDVPSPPSRYFYRLAGVNCAGVEGP
jgi:hypothetical protein